MLYYDYLFIYIFTCFIYIYVHIYIYSLGHHYHKSNLRRTAAFKYKVKSADQAISRGAFSDGLHFTQSAAELAESKAEIVMLLKIISMAVRDLGQMLGGLSQMQPRRNSFIASTPNPNLNNTNNNTNNNNNNNNNTHPSSGLKSEYLKLKVAMEAKLDKLSKGHVKAEEASPGNKNRLLISRQPSERLTWQPSYLASKQDSEDDDDDEENSINSNAAAAKKKSFCIIA
jgi:hypothetical protein